MAAPGSWSGERRAVDLSLEQTEEFRAFWFGLIQWALDEELRPE